LPLFLPFEQIDNGTHRICLEGLCFKFKLHLFALSLP
jgi:hypothetical protein